MKSKKSILTLGIAKETTTPWERRVPFTPQGIKMLLESAQKEEEEGYGSQGNGKRFRVEVQGSLNRCYSDAIYREVGSEIVGELSEECTVIAGIKPIKKLEPNKTYIMYTRLATGAESLRPYLREIIEKRICIIDYERIRDGEGRSLVGSSKLAGFVGLFNAFRVMGELLLLRRNMNTPFLNIGGSAYMHRDKAHCISSLRMAFDELLAHDGLPLELHPFVVGITGRGIVAEGAIELLQACAPC
jgi:hypothetical protein